MNRPVYQWKTKASSLFSSGQWCDHAPSLTIFTACVLQKIILYRELSPFLS